MVGVGAGAGISAFGVLRVTRLPLRPVSESEVVRLAEDVVADQQREGYAEAREAFLHLTDGDTGPGRAGGRRRLTAGPCQQPPAEARRRRSDAPGANQT